VVDQGIAQTAVAAAEVAVAVEEVVLELGQGVAVADVAEEQEEEEIVAVVQGN